MRNDKLLNYIESAEHFIAQRETVSGFLSEVFAEAKSKGFDVKTMKRMIRERKQTPTQRAEEEALAEIYRAALGMLDGTPLGEHGRARLSKPNGGDQGGGASRRKTRRWRISTARSGTTAARGYRGRTACRGGCRRARRSGDRQPIRSDRSTPSSMGRGLVHGDWQRWNGCAGSVPALQDGQARQIVQQLGR